MKFKKIKYPLFYNVDDIPVILELKDGQVVCRTSNGKPYPIGKAIVNGIQISKSDYDKLAQQYWF